MNKYLVIGVLGVLIVGAVYLTKKDVAPTTQAPKSVSVSTSEQVSNAESPIASVSEKRVDASHPTVQSSNKSLSSITSTTIEQTQNAADFNAPGAGTAQQKAGAAAAANKAYQESKQQSH